jgi:hypothetical protein
VASKQLGPVHPLTLAIKRSLEATGAVEAPRAHHKRRARSAPRNETLRPASAGVARLPVLPAAYADFPRVPGSRAHSTARAPVVSVVVVVIVVWC